MNYLVPSPKWVAFAIAILLLLGAALAAMVERQSVDFNKCPLCEQRVSVRI